MSYDPKTCACGHPQSMHAMDMTTFRCAGRCYKDAYKGGGGKFTGWKCECTHYRPPSTKD